MNHLLHFDGYLSDFISQNRIISIILTFEIFRHKNMCLTLRDVEAYIINTFCLQVAFSNKNIDAQRIPNCITLLLLTTELLGDSR